MKNLFLIIVLFVILLGFTICSAPLVSVMPFNYFGTITLYTFMIWILEKIYKNFYESDNKN